MKHLFTLFASLLFTATFAQQNLIAIKGTTTDAIATTLEEAINIAQPNDKIYLPGGNYTLNDSQQKTLYRFMLVLGGVVYCDFFRFFLFKNL